MIQINNLFLLFEINHFNQNSNKNNNKKRSSFFSFFLSFLFIFIRNLLFLISFCFFIVFFIFCFYFSSFNKTLIKISLLSNLFFFFPTFVFLSHPKKQVVFLFLFSFLTLMKTQKEKEKGCGTKLSSKTIFIIFNCFFQKTKNKKQKKQIHSSFLFLFCLFSFVLTLYYHLFNKSF